MKYIMFEFSGMRWPILFPEMVTHSDIARSITGCFPGFEVVSAGFCSRYGDVYGESVSLKVKSDQADSIIIKKMLGLDNT
jgi:hypothetical protein